MSWVVVLFDFAVAIVHKRSIVWLIQPLEKLFRNPVLLLKISFVGNLKLASKYINFCLRKKMLLLNVSANPEILQFHPDHPGPQVKFVNF